MAAVITLTDVQHWGACRRVVLRQNSTLTEAARRWLAEQQVEVEIEASASTDAGQPTLGLHNDDIQSESLLEVQLMRLAPRVLDRLGVGANNEATREAVRAAIQDRAQEENLGLEHATDARGSGQQLQRAIITVLGKDRVGIISAITLLLSTRQANVLDINQTLFGDLFSMNMSVDISKASVSFADLKEALEKAGDELQLKVLVQREAVFDYMHRV